MPDYEAHRWLAQKVGLAIGILMSIVSLIGGFLISQGPQFEFLLIQSAVLGYLAYASTIVGGVAPDIDLSQPNATLKFASKPYRQLVNWLKFTIPIVLIFGVASLTQDQPVSFRLLAVGTAVALVILIVRSIPDFLHSIMPGHRTLTHGFPFWLVFGSLVMLAINLVLKEVGTTDIIQTFLPLSVGIPVFLGVVTHVSLDTLNSFVKQYAPETLKRRAAQYIPWVPTRKPVIFDIPQLAKVALDSSAPWTIRLFVVFTALYGVIPFDLISDALIGIGWIEDFGIYMGLRRLVYSGYSHGEGVVDTLRRELSTVIYVYVPVAVLSVLSLVVYFLWIA